MSQAQNFSDGITRLNPEGVVDASAYGFSQAVVVKGPGHYIHISGQFAGDAEGNLVGDTMEAQMKQTFLNLKRVIDASGGKPEHVVFVRVLIVDHEDRYLAPLMEEEANLFGSNHPASTLIPVPRLALEGMLFEIEATLFVPDE